ncbi:MAG: DUF2339 domain-containing protein [Deltaproteobacteria bacterium]|nr:DUF2339 domain-containing protein [Candidatus Zymogenaceae bacterium]
MDDNGRRNNNSTGGDDRIDTILQEMKLLRSEVSSLKERLSRLEETEQERPERTDDITAADRAKKPAAAVPARKEEKPKKPGPVKRVKSEGESLETRIGGRWLNRIGIVAVVIGVAFFIKYAFDNNWIGPTGRIVLGILSGLGLVGWGQYLYRTYRIYAQGLIGGGIAILYVSIFAAHDFYALIPYGAALVAVAFITAAAVILSAVGDDIALFIIVLVGGFATPLLLGFADDHQVSLLTFVTVLNLGVLAAAYQKNWKIINFLAFFATLIIFGLWADKYYIHESHLVPTQVFLTIFLVIFAALSFSYNITHRKKTSVWDLLLIFATAFSFFSASYANLTPEYESLMGVFAGGMAAIYFGLGYLTHRRNAGDSLLILGFYSVALAFVMVMIPIELDGAWITVGWATQAAALVWIGLAVQSRAVGIGGLALFLVVLGRLFILDFDVDITAETFRIILNERFLTALYVAAALGFGVYMTQRALKKDPGDTFRKVSATMFFIAAHFVMIAALSAEAYDYFEMKRAAVPVVQGDIYKFADAVLYAQRLSLSGIWMVYSAVLIVFGIAAKNRTARIFAISLFAVTIIKVFFFDLSRLERFYRIVSFIGLGVILLAVSYLYTRFKDSIIDLVIGDEQKPVQNTLREDNEDL